MKILSAITGSPLFLYFKLGIVAAAIAGASYIAWDYRGALNEKEKQEAVNNAVRTAVSKIEKDLEIERGLRQVYQSLAESKYEQLLKSFANIRVEHTTIEKNIYHEIEKNPLFYSQPLPPGGYEQWKRARALSQGSVSEPPSPLASPSPGASLPANPTSSNPTQ